MNLSKKRAPLGKKILYPILGMVAFQILIVWLFVFQLGLFDSVVRQSKNNFSNHALYSTQAIDTEMWVYYSDLSSFDKSIYMLESSYVSALQSHSSYVPSDEFWIEAVSNAAELHVDGLYVELFQPSGDRKRFFLPIDRDKTMLVLQQGEQSFLNYIQSLISGQEDLYQKSTVFAEYLDHLENTDRKSTGLHMFECGDWSPVISLGESENYLFYTIPIRYKQEQFGFLGTVIERERLHDFLGFSSLPDDIPHQSILLRQNRSSDDYEIISTYRSGMEALSEKEMDTILPKIVDSLSRQTQYSTTIRSGGRSYLLSSHMLENVSSLDTPFTTSNFHLIFLAPENHILYGANLLRQTFLFLIILFILMSIIIAFYTTKQVVAPISFLTSAIQRKGFSESSAALPKTNINEIDLLTSTIDSQRQNLKDFHQMINDTLQASETKLVTFYVDKSSQIVRGFGTFQSLLGDSFPEQYLLTLSADEFEQRMAEVYKNFSLYTSNTAKGDEADLETEVYFDTLRQKYICVKSRNLENGKTLVIIDYTNYILEQEKIKKERDYDMLTSLLNRLSFTEKATKYLAENPDKPVTMVMWDLDSLKQLNDTYGHDIGDLYLCTAGEILRRLDPERSFVSRVSGDEFFAFLFDFDSKEESLAMIYDIHKKLNETLLQLPNGQTHSMSASCGFTYAVVGSYEDLKKKADSAMYVSKKSAKGSIHEFQPGNVSHES